MNLGINDRPFEPTKPSRTKRKGLALTHSNRCGSGEIDASSVKRAKHIGKPENTFVDDDKENCHQVRSLAPRARTAKVLAELMVDAPTDCSDIEFLDESEDETLIGRVYKDHLLRISDKSNERYHFSIFEDHSVN